MSDPTTSDSTQKADIGVTGLAVMGSNLARNFARNGFVTAVHNRSYAKTEALIDEHGSRRHVRAVGVVGGLRGLAGDAAQDPDHGQGRRPDRRRDRRAGRAGRAGRHHHRRRQRASSRTPAGGRPRLQEKGIHFVGCGVSGGEEGALNGPSIMPGGSAKSYESLGPILEKISAHVDGAPCCTHIGTDGAGHFVKMVHNGIEYADMQLIAEAYDLLRRGAGLTPAEIGEIFGEWNKGDLDSFLIEITAAGAGPGRRRDRQAVRRRRAGRGRDEGHRHLDRADRAGPGHPGVRHRRGGVRPRPVVVDGAAGGGAPGSCPGRTTRGRSRIGTRSSRTSGSRCTRRRSSPTRRVSTRSSPARRSTAGTSMSVRWPGSGAAAASSGRSS